MERPSAAPELFVSRAIKKTTAMIADNSLDYPATRVQHTPMRLLIIEDDRDAADYLVKAFREVGHVADWAADGDLPEAEYDYLATAGVGMGFQVATRLVEREPPDVEGATRFCTRMFMGGIRALVED